MSPLHGADADELDRLAVEFIRAADELDGEGHALTGVLNRVSWLGDLATRYLDNWTGIQIPKIGLSTQFLRDSATQLQGHAQEQRNASAGGPTSGGAPLGSLGRWSAQQAQESTQARIANELAPVLERMRTATPDEQTKWWNSLNDEQRAALIALMPIQVLTLAGLSSAERQQARDQYASDISPEIVTGSASVDGSLEIDVWLISGEAGFELEKRTFRDGHVEVTFGADMAIGGNVEVAKVLADRGVAGTYTFASEAEYQAFVDGMIERIADPNLADTGLEVAAYLLEHGDHFKSIEVSAGASVSVEAGVDGEYGASVEVGGSVSAEYNRIEDSTTLSASARIDAAASLTPLGIEASGGAEVTGSMTIEDGAPSSISLSFDYHGSASADLLGGSPGLSGSLGVDHSGTATISFDLTDRLVREQFGETIAALQRGDVSGALASAGALIDQGEIVIQQFVGETESLGFDAKAVKAELNISENVATSTYVKPPGSPMFKLD